MEESKKNYQKKYKKDPEKIRARNEKMYLKNREYRRKKYEINYKKI